MTLTTLASLLLAYFVFAALFIGVSWKSKSEAKWLGLVTIAVAAPFFYWFGAFSEQFTSGICYSNAIGMVSNAVESTDNPRALAEQIRELPLYGYETVCNEVEEAAGKLPKASAP